MKKEQTLKIILKMLTTRELSADKLNAIMDRLLKDQKPDISARKKKAFNTWYEFILPLSKGSMENIRSREDSIIKMCEDFLNHEDLYIDSNMRKITERVIDISKHLKQRVINYRKSIDKKPIYIENSIVKKPIDKKPIVKKPNVKKPIVKKPKKEKSEPSKYYNKDFVKSIVKRNPGSNIDNINKVLDKFESSFITSEMYTGLMQIPMQNVQNMTKFEVKKKYQQPVVGFSEKQLKFMDEQRGNRISHLDNLNKLLKCPALYQNKIFGEWFVNRLLILDEYLVEILFNSYKHMRANILMTFDINNIPRADIEGVQFTTWIKDKLDQFYDSN
jgi:hypothetical protein